MLSAGYFVVEGRAGENKGFEFPTVRPEKVGMSQSRFEQAKRYARSAGGSGMIVRNGKVVCHWGDQQKRYDIKSATKSFGATMLGVAIQDDKIELDAPAQRYHPSLGVPPQNRLVGRHYHPTPGHPDSRI
jgi:CubicO group peptidase (beta-lactamase class C family)